MTSDSRRYEERLDPDLDRLVAPGLEVVQSATLPVRPIRLVGDIGIRSFWGCYRAVDGLVRQRRAIRAGDVENQDTAWFECAIGAPE